MSHCPQFRCPQCHYAFYGTIKGATAHVDVTILQLSTGECMPYEGVHVRDEMWDDDTMVVCEECHYEGTVKQFSA